MKHMQIIIEFIFLSIVVFLFIYKSLYLNSAKNAKRHLGLAIPHHISILLQIGMAISLISALLIMLFIIF